MEPDFRTAKFLTFDLAHRKEVFPIPRRVLPYMDLTYCLEGTMEYYYNDEHVLLRSGDAILFPPGSVRQRLHTKTPNYYSSFNIRLSEGVTLPIAGYLPKCVRSNTIVLLETIRRDFNQDSPHRQEKCAAIFSYLYHQLKETVLDKDNPHIKNIKQYIISHLSEPLSLEEIATAVYLTPNYLCTLFKKHTGQTIVEYIIMQRIDLAKRLIIAKDWPLHQISEQCGFSDYKHFSHTFKKVTGVVPKEYRKVKQNIF